MDSSVNESADPLGRAMDDYQRGEPGTLRYRDGADTRDGHVEAYYFSPPSQWAAETISFLERLASLEGPVLDVGCGAGQHALWLARRGVDVTGIDVSPHAIRAARERGLEDARVVDMFELEAAFDPGRFRAVHAVGTQVGLAGSLAGVRELLAAFAHVTDEAGVAVVHNYDPAAVDEDLLGFRPDPRDGIAHRCFHLEYEPAIGDDEEDERTRVVGRTLHFLLFDADRLADATIGTPWTVEEVVSMPDATYKAVLTKSGGDQPAGVNR